MLCEAACGAIEPLLYLDYISWSVSQTSCSASSTTRVSSYGGHVGVVRSALHIGVRVAGIVPCSADGSGSNGPHEDLWGSWLTYVSGEDGRVIWCETTSGGR
jgi:hypothetical protein